MKQSLSNLQTQQSLINKLRAQIQSNHLQNLQLLQQISKEQSTIITLQVRQSCEQRLSFFQMDLINSQIISPSSNSNLFNSLNSHTFQENSNIFSQTQQKFRNELKFFYQHKFLKVLKKKAQLLQNLASIKSQSSLFDSHKRVILKQFIQQLRLYNTMIQNYNSDLLSQTLDLSPLGIKLQELQTILKRLLETNTQVSHQQI